MSQKDKETFKEYAQRWRELAAQINPPLEEKEITKIFLKTLSLFYECMISSAPSDFTEMVNIGMRLEEGVLEGRLSKGEVSSSKKYGSGFAKRKEGETNSVSLGRHKRHHVRRNPQLRQHQHQFSSVIPGAPAPDIENCYPLKYEVQKLVKSGMVSFEDRAPNVKANSLPAHGNASVNMVDGCPGNFRVFAVNPHGCMIVKRYIQRLMDENVIQIQQSRDIDDVNVIVPVFKTPERVVIQYNSNNNNIANRSVSPLVIRLAGLVPYAFDKDVPYHGRVFGPVFPKEVEDVSIIKKVDMLAVNPVSAPVCQSGESSKLKPNNDDGVEALQKVLEQAYVEHDVTVDQFDHIIANITSCNNLSFCDEELPEEG
ncbi:hypothetical protein KIW84_021581 [Lathyrus oleraceus]|uniref:Gag-pro-like protein n=1 Tax=Pisum sativum TaxID=3888 RepID=A0A9D4Y882_PEA|nr:hypothetical protein KIW84_021581 [Pisum sativum]